MTLPVVFTANGPSGYNLTKSLRFRSSASAYLNRTFSTPTNNKIWTWSGWVKRGDLGTWRGVFAGGNTGGAMTKAEFYTDDTLYLTTWNGSSNVSVLQTTQVFRDPSAWYHLLFVYDISNATANNRQRMYVNGQEVTAFASRTNFNTTDTSYWNNASYSQEIGKSYQTATTTSKYFDGYLAEVNFVDGQALTPSSFGETSTTTGVWQPKKYTGTYGTNGFYLPFTDTTSTTTLGYDFSGNGNNWTTNNISLTAGSTYDSMTDVPTLTSATTANYCVINPLDNGGNTLSNGNLTLTGFGNAFRITRSTLGMTSGKWYCEFVITSEGAPSRICFGLLGSPATLSGSLGDTSNGYSIYESGANILKYNNSTATTLVSGGSLDPSDVQMLAYDADAGKLWFGKNGNWFASGDPVAGTNQVFSSVSGQPYFVAVQAYNSSDVGQINFGQQPFSYTPPSGFVALNTFNLATPTIGATSSSQANKYFDATLFTGTGANATITNSGSMQPDFVWGKSRSNAFNNLLMDSVRGTGVTLFSNSTSADYAVTDAVTSFNSNGFSYGVDPTCNTNGSTNVFWQWRASNATAVTNTAGSITSTVSANTTAGFSVVTYTGNATNGATVGHGLGVSPSMIIGKIRSTTGDWYVWQTAMGDNFMKLNTTAAQLASTANGVYNTASFSSTVFALGSGSSMNASGGTFVAYCFSAVAGYSAFGSYTGNGSTDGPFIYLGFRPRFVLQKSTAGGNWNIWDTTRNTYNVIGEFLHPDNADAADTGSRVDVLSNGFKLRVGGANNLNDNGQTYIYACFAEFPFKFSNAR
jgi:hypothetical protein